MNKIILSLLALVIIGFPTAFAEINVMSDYYEMGNFLEIGGYFEGYTTIDIVGDNFEKGYQVDVNRWYQFGLPLTEAAGYTPGIYDVIITEGDKTYTQQFGLEVVVPQFTLYRETSMIPLNEYAFFYGQVVGIEPRDLSFSGSVLIQVLDSNGNLVEDNWQQKKDTAKNTDAATKSQFRAPINSGDMFLTTQDDNNIFEHRTALDNGYRLYVKLDPTIYKPYHVYTIKAQHDDYIRTVDFMVLDYKGSVPSEVDDICINERKNLNHIQGVYDDLIEGKAYDLAHKYELRIDNFKFTSGCE